MYLNAEPIINCSAFRRTHATFFPQVQLATSEGRKLLHSHSMEIDAVKRPIRGLVEKAIGFDAVSSMQSCLITNPHVPFSCDDPLPLDPERDTLESLIRSSRYLLVTTKSQPVEQATSFVQKSPFLSRINRVQDLRQSSH